MQLGQSAVELGRAAELARQSHADIQRLRAGVAEEAAARQAAAGEAETARARIDVLSATLADYQGRLEAAEARAAASKQEATEAKHAQ